MPTLVTGAVSATNATLPRRLRQLARERANLDLLRRPHKRHRR